VSDTLVLNSFIEKAGFFPLAIKYADTVFVFCRIGTGHLGQTGKIAVLASSNGTDWQRWEDAFGSLQVQCLQQKWF